MNTICNIVTNTIFQTIHDIFVINSKFTVKPLRQTLHIKT